jgi:hypothetical protein
MADTNPEGRPPLTSEQKKDILLKLEPFLRAGLSVNKSLREAGIANSTFYKIANSDPEFMERIRQFQQFISVMYNRAVIKHLQDIIMKQNPKGDQPGLELSKEDIDFLKWFGTNSNLTKEEYGERKDISLWDAEQEVQKIASVIDEWAGKGDKNELPE